MPTILKYLRQILAIALGVFVTLLAVGVWSLQKREDLSLWHKVEFEHEFSAGGGTLTFADYLAQEEFLFQELDERVYDEIGPAADNRFDRYYRGSAADPSVWERNWNRTFVLKPDSPVAGVLLIHGMSDSPYSMRSIGLTLQSAGANVVGLRLPGHGTAPVGLTRISADDLTAAVELAVRHLRREMGDRPLFIIGYSAGGSLAVEYALRSLSDTGLPRVEGVVLASPAIGVSGAAAFAVWQARLGRLLRMPKLQWQKIGPEYDPFKYNSFAVNAGDVVFQLTRRIGERIDRLAASNELSELPPILAFQSIVDATVSTAAVTEGLFGRLPRGQHELVIFDVDRTEAVGSLLTAGLEPQTLTSIHSIDQPFAITGVSNRSPESEEVAVYRSLAGTDEISVEDLGLKWPPGIYSLSHVAMLFPASDPLYGAVPPEDSRTLYLGGLGLRGERGVFRISATDMLRQRWNPFYSYLEGRTLEFMNLPPCGESSTTICAAPTPTVLESSVPRPEGAIPTEAGPGYTISDDSGKLGSEEARIEDRTL